MSGIHDSIQEMSETEGSSQQDVKTAKRLIEDFKAAVDTFEKRMGYPQ